MNPTTTTQPRERTIEGDRVIFLGEAVLVASTSEPGIWHRVENGRCDCKGFSYRGNCRHIKRALVAHEIEHREHMASLPKLVALPTSCGYCKECDSERALPGDTLCTFCRGREDRRAVR